MTLKEAQHVHCIGIGGIGLSALARMLKHQGKSVSGSDASYSTVIEGLLGEGIKVLIGTDPVNIPTETDFVIYTAAIASDNAELLEAHHRELPLLTYFEALGEMSEGYYTIAVSGTHGKTTTTAMIAHLAREAALDPTVIVGSLMTLPDGTKTNFIPGSSNMLIVEACEYKRHFLNLNPNILVITNIEADHLDYYRDLLDIEDAFREFVEKVPETGFIVCDNEKKSVRKVTENSKAQVIDYNDILDEITLQVPGSHNRENARAAVSVAHLLGVHRDAAINALSSFKGTWRRSERKGVLSEGALLYDDYAHHPTEIKTTIRGFKEKFSDKRINVLFQPHLYSRTEQLFKEFTHAFGDADNVVILPIYAAREEFDPNISSELLVAAIRGTGVEVRHASREESLELLKQATSKDIWITMGAGDVYRIGEEVL